MRKICLLLSICLLEFFAPAFAQSPTDPALDFNIFVKDFVNFNGSTSTQGPVGMGGNLLVNSNHEVCQQSSGTFTVDGIKTGLAVGGSVNFSGSHELKTNNKSFVKIGVQNTLQAWYMNANNNGYDDIHITNNSQWGSHPKIVMLNLKANDASAFPVVPANITNASPFTNNFSTSVIDFNAAFATLEANSLGMQTISNNVILRESNLSPISYPYLAVPSQVKIVLEPGLNVLNIDGSVLNTISNFIFETHQPSASRYLVVNVNAPGAFNWQVFNTGGHGGISNCKYILWNFYNATSVNMTGAAVRGTIFAPFADITKGTGAEVDGQIIGKSYTHNGSGQNHYAVFESNVPFSSATTASFSVNNSSQCLSGNSFQFTNTSTGSNLSYSWDFGDNTSSTAANPTKTYATAGTYQVSLTTTGSGGSDVTTHQVTVTNVIPSVSIAANPAGAICSGTSVTFTATPVNGGASPVYVWKKNGVTVGSNSATYTATGLANNDVITVEMTSNAACASTTPVSPASPVTMTVTSTVVPSVTIAASPSGAICVGTPVTFTATPVNGGTNPAYQWKKNGVNVGTNSDTYTDNGLNDNDVVTVEITSNANCASSTPVAASNPISVTVNAVAGQPAAFTVSSATVYQGQVGVTYTVPNNPSVTYNWSYSGTGATVSGSGNSVSLSFDGQATGGTLSVTATNGCGTSASRDIVITVLPYMTWICGNGNNWNDGANWDGGFVPYGSIRVHIPDNSPCQPVITGNKEVFDLVVEEGADIDINNGGSLEVKGDATIEGEVCGGYLILNGANAQTLSGTGTICNLEVDNPSGVTITPGDTIRISQTYKPTDGVLITNGGLELLSDSTGTAVILAHPGICTTYISGNVIVNRYFPGGRRAFRFLAHPFAHSIGLDQLTDDIDITGQGGAANGFTTTTTNNPSAFWYNTLTGNGSAVDDNTGWIPFTHTDGAGVNAWNPMQGARIFIRGDKGQGLGCDPCTPSPAKIDMVGEINQCDVTVNLETNTNSGYNFIGNPYPSNIDMSLITRGAAVGANFSVWDPHQGVFGAYVTQPFNAPYVLPAYSSFIVTSSAQSSITFSEAAKTGATPTGNLFKTTSSSFGPNSVQLRILSNGDSVSWDRLLIFFDNTTTSDKDAQDAKKLSNPSLDFYTIGTDNTKMSIDFRPLVSGQVIPLGLRIDSQKIYTIKVEDYDVPAGTQLYLKDKLLNQSQPLSQGMSYSFTVDGNPLSQGDGRFELSVGNTNSVSEVSGSDDLNLQLYPNPASESVAIQIGGEVKAGKVRMVNMVGQPVFESELKNSQNMLTVPVHHLAAGVYIITVQCGDKMATQRLIKQ